MFRIHNSEKLNIRVQKQKKIHKTVYILRQTTFLKLSYKQYGNNHKSSISNDFNLYCVNYRRDKSETSIGILL